jgi:hypothetical protein
LVDLIFPGDQKILALCPLKNRQNREPVGDVVEVVEDEVVVVGGTVEIVGNVVEVLEMCCRSKPTGEQRQVTRGAGRLPGLLVGPGASVNDP